MINKAEMIAEQLASAAKSAEIWSGILYNVRLYGAAGDGITDDSSKVQNAISAAHEAGGGTVYIPGGTYLASAKITVKENVRLELSKGASIKRGYNGAVLELEKNTEIVGGTIDANGSTYTGSVIVINTGENAVGQQGYQLLEDVLFKDYDTYAVEYTSANKGYLSKIVRCKFTPVNNTATGIKWPNEGAAGGNRYILDCYSASPLCNLDNCDNGIIMGNTVGVQAADTRGALIFGTSAKKVIVTNNRLAHGTNLLTIAGSDHVISDNEISSQVAFDPGCINVKYDSTNTDSGFSGTVPYATNYISTKGQEVAFDMTWTSTGTAPSFGNADVRARYVIDGRSCRVEVSIVFGSTTTFGTGTWRFSLPFASASTSYYSGLAFLSDRPGAVLFKPSDGYLTLYSNSNSLVTESSPFVWAAGNILTFRYEYFLS